MTLSLNTDLLNAKTVAGTQTVSFVNAQYVLKAKVTVGFKPNMVCIQSLDPVITFGLDSVVDDGFIVNAYCITGAVSYVCNFSYLCTK